MTRTQLAAFSLQNTFGSDRLDTEVLFHSVLRIYKTGSFRVI